MKLNERHILIVDDDPTDLELTTELISNIDDPYKYIIYKAANAQEAIHIYAKKPVECALVDYELPTMNGTDLVGILNSLPSHISLHSRFPVIIISGCEDEKRFHRTEDSDALGYIAKNKLGNPGVLKDAIDRLLDGEEDEKAYICI